MRPKPTGEGTTRMDDEIEHKMRLAIPAGNETRFMERLRSARAAHGRGGGTSRAVKNGDGSVDVTLCGDALLVIDTTSRLIDIAETTAKGSGTNTVLSRLQAEARRTGRDPNEVIKMLGGYTDDPVDLARFVEDVMVGLQGLEGQEKPRLDWMSDLVLTLGRQKRRAIEVSNADPSAVVVVRRGDCIIALTRGSSVHDLHLPGGKWEEEDGWSGDVRNTLATAVREVREETGIVLDQSRVRYVTRYVTRSGRRVVGYTASAPEDAPDAFKFRREGLPGWVPEASVVAPWCTFGYECATLLRAEREMMGKG